MMKPSNQQHFLVHTVLNMNGFYRLPMHVLSLILKLLEVEHATNPKIIQQNTIVGLLALVPNFDPSMENFFSQPKHLKISEEIRVYMHSVLKDLAAQLKVAHPQSLSAPALPISAFPYSGMNYPPYYPANNPDMLQQMQQMMYYRTFGINPSLGLISNSKPIEKEKESSNDEQKKEAIYHESQSVQNQSENNRQFLSDKSEQSNPRVNETSKLKIIKQQKTQQKRERLQVDSRIIFETSNPHVDRESIIVEDFPINSNQQSVKIQEGNIVPMQIILPNSCSIDVQTQMTLTEDDLIVNIRDATPLIKKSEKVQKRNRGETNEVYNRKPTQSRGAYKKKSDNVNNHKEQMGDTQNQDLKNNKLNEKVEKTQKNHVEDYFYYQIKINQRGGLMRNNSKQTDNMNEKKKDIRRYKQREIQNAQNMQKEMNDNIQKEINQDIQKEQHEFNLKFNFDQLDSIKQSKCQEQNFLRVPLSHDEDINPIEHPCDLLSQLISHNHEEEDLLPHEKQQYIENEIEQIKPSPQDILQERLRLQQEKRILERQRELLEERERQMERERVAERERERLEELERQEAIAKEKQNERQLERQLRHQKILEAIQERRRLQAEWQRLELQRVNEEKRQQQLVRLEQRRQLQLLQAEQQLKKRAIQLQKEHLIRYKSCICEGKSHYEDYYCCFTCSEYFHWQCFNMSPVFERTECFNCRLRKMDPLNAVKDVVGEYYITDITSHKFSVCLNFENYAYIREKSHRNHEIQLRCFRIDPHMETTEITWPDECIISLNDEKISQLYALRINSLLKKRKDYPITLPNFKLFNDETAEENYRNIRISLQICPQSKLEATQKRINNRMTFLFGIYCIKKITVDALYQQIMEKEIQHCPETYLTDLITQLSLEKEVFRLIDPFAWTQIVTPVRGIKCNHGQCFDLKTYLTFMAGMTNRNWRCPVCLQETKEFKYDSVYNELIKRFAGTQQLPNQVTVLSDGSFILKMMAGDDDSQGQAQRKSKRERKNKKMEEKELQKLVKNDAKMKIIDQIDSGEVRPALIKQQHIEIENQSDEDEYILPTKNKKQLSSRNKKSNKGRKLQQSKNKQ